MATKCTSSNLSILSTDIIESIVKSHDEDFITDLSFADQREVVYSIANNLYTEAVLKSGKTVGEHKKELNTLVSNNIEEYTEEVVYLNKQYDSGNKDLLPIIRNIQDQIIRNKAVLDNIEDLFSLSNIVLATFDGINYVKKDNLESGEVVSEAGIERTSYSDSFTLELNSKDTSSGRLKKFLAFIPNYKYEEGELVQEETFIGTTSYVGFNAVYDELHRLLVNLPPDKGLALTKLQLVANSARATENNSLAWIEGFIEMYNSAPFHIKKEFLSDMAKHKIDMNFIMYSKTKYGYTLRLHNDDSSSKARKLQGLWRRDHKRSYVIVDGKYSKERRQDLLDQFKNLKSLSNGIDKSNSVYALLASIGIMPNKQLIDDIFINGSVFYFNNNTKLYANDFIANDNILHKLLKNIPINNSGDSTKDITVEDSNYITNENFIRSLANASALYEIDEFSNSFRVGDKIIYTFSNNQYYVNRFRDLKQDKSLRNNLQNTLFSKSSLYLGLLQDKTTDFLNWFDYTYVSLNPLKKAKGKRSDSLNKVGEVDHEVTKIGYYNSGRNYESYKINGKIFKARKSSFFSPTNSDKSRIMSFKGLSFEAVETRKFKINETVQNIATIKDSYLDLFIDTTIQPEIERINVSTIEGFKEKLNLETYKGDLFYLIPQLNEFKITKYVGDTAVGEELFLDSIRVEQGLTTKTRAELKLFLNKIFKDKASIKKAKLIELGLLDTKTDKFVHLENIRNSNETFLSVDEMILDMTFNYMLATANIFQLVIGDPAQYFKSKADNLIDQVLDTYSNIGKRLAAEIAPGIEAEHEDTHYIQVFANDIVSESVSLDYYKKLFKNNPEYIKKYKEIISTDAQEYTTWKEHLGLLRDYGRITLEEYKNAYIAFDNGIEPKKELFNKVLQPLKPVYVNNIIKELGSTGIDIKYYIKSSSFPLIPTLTKGLQLDNLRIALEKLERTKGMNVRFTYKTATKVGFPLKTNAVTLLNKEGNFKKDIDLNNTNSIVLERKGFRIQQDIPYDASKETITVATQPKKLLWTNTKDKYLKEHTEYLNLYEKLYLKGREALYNRLLDKNGRLDLKQLSNILKKELKTRGETSKPLMDGLEIITDSYESDGTNVKHKKFAVPLWLSPYSDKYVSLLNSIVKKEILTHKFQGKSFVLGSEVGFKAKTTILEGERGKKYINKNLGIIVTSSYNPVKGLLGVRKNEETGKILPAQIMIPFKFRDTKGNLLDAKDFVKEDGTLDYKRLPKNILKSFGFRIPTQLHSSMASIEVVGFLPSISGDLIIAPDEFTVQMGSDFDVDKLYMYTYNTTYDEKTKTLSKLVEEDTIKGIQNKLLDIHIDIMSKDDDVLQQSIATPLGFGKYLELADTIAKSKKKNENIPSLLDDEYQKIKFFDGISGKNGIGMFSIDSIFNALAQEKKLTLLENTKNGKTPVRVEFGNKYEISNGDLSNIYTLNKFKKRFKTEVVAAAQNLSVDNANEQGMFKVNMNNETFGVYSILNFLGFEEEISASFIAQPIIVDYVKTIQQQSILTPYNTNLQSNTVRDLTIKYTEGLYYTEEHDLLADFKNKDASSEMLKMIEQQKEYPQYGLYQVSILNKFIKLQEQERPIGQLKKFLNLDSKGFNKNMYINKKNNNEISTLNSSLVHNATKLIGDYTILQDDKGKDYQIITPTTLAGFDYIYGNKTLIEMFSPLFLESIPEYNFDKIIPAIEKILGKQDGLYEKDIVKIKDDYKTFLMTSIKDVSNIEKVRVKVLFDLKTDPDSLYKRLNKIKAVRYGVTNRFLDSLEVTKDKFVEINYNNAVGDNFDESAIYLAFIDLFRQTEPIEGVIPAKLAEDLILYSLLRGGNKADQFLKFIPVEVLKDILDLNNTINKQTTFLNQWVRHNSERLTEVTLATKENLKQNKGKLKGTQFKFINKDTIETSEGLPMYIKTSENTYKNLTANIYHKINNLGISGLTEYNIQGKIKSIMQSNNVIDETKYIKKEKNKDKIEQSTIQGNQIIKQKTNSTSNLVTVNQFSDKLNWTSAKNMLKSIVVLNKEFLNYSTLATALLNKMPENVLIVEGNGNTYNPNTSTITIDRTLLKLDNRKHILQTIIHESLHVLTSNYSNAFTQGKKLPKDIRSSLARLNGFKNTLIDSIPKGEELVKFEAIIGKYLLNAFKTNPAKLSSILNDTYVHQRVKDIAKRVLTFKTTNGLNIEEIEYFDNLKNTTYLVNDTLFYYSLLNLKEFIAVIGSSPELANKYEALAGGNYIERIKIFFKEILKAIGITNNTAIEAALTDIFTVANVKQDKIPVKEKSNLDIAIENNTIFTFNNEDYFIKYGDIFNIRRPDIPVYVKEGQQRTSFINKYVKDISKRDTGIAINEFDDTTFRPFVYKNRNYSTVIEAKNTAKTLDYKSIVTESYKQNPEIAAKYIKYNDNNHSDDLNYYFGIKDIQEEIVEISKIKSKDLLDSENLPSKQNYPVKVVDSKELQNTINYANRVISFGTKGSEEENITQKFENPFDNSPILLDLETIAEELIEKCKPTKKSRKAAHGLKGNFKKGNQWTIVKDLKGLPTHAQGGVDLIITNNNVHFYNGKGHKKAKHGMYIPYKGKSYKWEVSDTEVPKVEFGAFIKKVIKEPQKKIKVNKKLRNNDFNKGNSWKLVKDLKGALPHFKGGINLEIGDQGIKVNNKNKSIKAKCGIMIRKSA